MMSVQSIRAVIGEIEKFAAQMRELAEADASKYGARATCAEADRLMTIAAAALLELTKLENDHARD